MRSLAVLGCVAALTFVPAVNCIEFPPGRVCTALFAYGLSASVIDADSGAPIGNAVLTLREGDYVEVMQQIPTGSYVGAGERPGTYDLTIEVPGVAGDTIHDIEIDADECHVIGVAIEVRVAPGQITVVPKNFACTDEARFGVSVKVLNKATNQPINDAVLTLAAEDYSEVMQSLSDGRYGGATERRGTYNLSVEADGFATVLVEDITVTQGVCHVNQVELTVELQPAQ